MIVVSATSEMIVVRWQRMVSSEPYRPILTDARVATKFSLSHASDMNVADFVGRPVGTPLDTLRFEPQDTSILRYLL